MPSAKWKDERSKAMYFIAAAYLALKKREDVVPWLMRSIAEQPGIRDTWLSLAEEYYDNENYLGAYHAVIEALKIKSCSASYATNGSSWSAYPHEVASVCAYHLNLKENARRHLENALMYEPANKDYLEKKRMLDMEQAPVSLILPKRKSCLRNGIIERVA